VEPLNLTAWLPEHFNELWHDHPRLCSISVVAPDGPALVNVDPAAFATAIDAVVDNAFKHGCLGTRVIVTVVRRGGNIVLTVVNDGTNIPEADRGRVFATPGRGLTTAAGIVRSFGGKIAALPQDRGARIAIVLPAAGG
jgi:signal transduction histidine kinase